MRSQDSLRIPEYVSFYESMAETTRSVFVRDGVSPYVKLPATHSTACVLEVVSGKASSYVGDIGLSSCASYYRVDALRQS
jgi:hypothetical protein